MMMNTGKHNQNNNKRKSDLIYIIFGNQNSPTQQEDEESDHDVRWYVWVLGSLAGTALGSKQLLLLLLKPQRSRRWGKDIDIFTTDGSRHIANWTEWGDQTIRSDSFGEHRIVRQSGDAIQTSKSCAPPKGVSNWVERFLATRRRWSENSLQLRRTRIDGSLHLRCPC